MLVPMKELLVEARRGRYAVAAFEFWSMDSAQVVLQAAQAADMPVILQAGPFEIDYAGFAALTTFARLAVEASGAPAALHLDHGDTLPMAQAAITAGFTSVMIDVSHQAYADNVRLTQAVVQTARPHQVTVEAELGRLAGSEAGRSASEEEAAQTDPEQAAEFVEQTGIDALAVAIGNAHGFYPFPPRINLDRLARIAALVAVPLVLHGGSDTPDEVIRRSIDLGIAKVNICTEFVAAFGRGYTKAQQAAGFKYNVPNLFGPARQAAYDLALAKIRLFANGKGR